ncbi:HipA family kinase [Shewanella oncorhynchi]|uniref:HipA family kinase n=1 Tax=Shewanella oncorhynchi TaxID=2726434 RepID=UPI003D7B39B6
MTIEVTEIIRKFEQGYTVPYLCNCNDGKQYVVKGIEATYEGLIKEWVCANIGIQFGLPIPKPVIIHVPSMFSQFGENPSLAIGDCFGSTYVSGLSEILYSQLVKLDTQTMLDLYAFDYWIKNGDRSLSPLGGNPNFFIDMQTKTAVVVDHNLAFDTKFSINDHKQLHIASRFWNIEQPRMFDRSIYEPKFNDALKGFDECIKYIPDIWLDNLVPEDGFLNQLRLTLTAYTQAEFWEGLK